MQHLFCTLVAPRRALFESLEQRTLLSGDIVLEWNALALEANKIDHGVGAPHLNAGPGRSARALAIVHGAIFDAINAIDGSYTPWLVTDVHPQRGASIDAAAAQAAHDTLAALYPYLKSTYDTALANDLKHISDTAAARGVAVGQAVASEILAARANDGSSAVESYTPGTLPGQWRPDPLHPTQTALNPMWGDVDTFAIESASQFPIAPAPALSSPEYAAAYNEVKALGGNGTSTPTIRTPEQAIIGNYWGYDGTPGLGTPPRLYNQIARTIAVKKDNSEIQNARYFALINFAMADAGISCWNDKYVYSFWRPVTAIRENDAGTGPSGLGSGNPLLLNQGDANWTPLGAPASNASGTNFTPPFPAYASGHATFGGALFRTIADFYGTEKIKFSFVSDEFNGVTKDQNGVTRPKIVRTFNTLSQAMEENGQSRIYLGIHWSFDKVEGIKCGKSIADYVVANTLRPVHNGCGNLAAAANSGMEFTSVDDTSSTTSLRSTVLNVTPVQGDDGSVIGFTARAENVLL